MAKIVISGAIYRVSFTTMKLFYLFAARIVILNTAPCFTYFFTANFEHLSTLGTVTRCGRYRTYLCKFFANLLRNCDSIRCVSFASKVNGIGYLSSDQDCDLMDSVSK